MITGLIHNNLIFAIGMTIIHSFWQITIIYLVMRLTLRMMSASSSAIKYRIAGFSMVSALLVSIITFIICYQPEPSGIMDIRPLQDASFRLAGEVIPPAKSFSLRSSLATALPWIVWIYFGGLLMMTLRMLSGSICLRRHARTGVRQPSPEIHVFFRQLCEKTGIIKKVRLFESFRIDIPEVIGYFKPLVIVPAGFFANMPFDQAGAILAHELAHIKRNDFLFNIIQSVIEMLFFYHPAIYLISSRTRDEREKCCDDMALAWCPGNETYARALARMAERGIKPSYPSVALMQNRKTLLERIRRILKQETMKTKISDRIFAGIIVIAGFGLIILTGAAALNRTGLAGHGSGKNFSLIPALPSAVNASPADSLIKADENSIVIRQEDEKGVSHTWEMKFDIGKLESLKVDGKKIPRSKFDNYREIIETTLKSVNSDAAKTASAVDSVNTANNHKRRIEVEKTVKTVDGIDTAKIRKEIRIEISRIDSEKLREDLESARKEIENINWDSLKTAMQSVMNPEAMQQLRVEIEKARQDIDREKLHEEMERELQQLDHTNADSLRIMIDRSIRDIDWDQLEKDLSFSLDTARLKLAMDLDKLDLHVIKESLNDIDWDRILSEAGEEMKRARIILSDSTSLWIHELELPRIREDIGKTLKSAGPVDMEEINRQTGEAMEQLEKARENLENTLKETEKKK